ncbi:MAG: hypothetical protein LBK26_01720 [Rickettsiales bacterium]|jgi:hypothetical protein|nr:hypothetical protein [Rickettsiales bacterium]
MYHLSRIAYHDARAKRGNFMLQALLALALVIAFMPFLVRKISGNEFASRMAATTAQIEAAAGAAREFIRDNADRMPYGVAIFKDDKFTDALESYGLSLGFVPKTPFGQNIFMTTVKSESETLSFIGISDPKTSAAAMAELAVRIGFWAAEFDADEKILRGATGGWEIRTEEFGWRPDKNTIYVRVPAFRELSELVAKRSKNTEDNKFHTDLIMGGYDIKGINDISAREGNFKTILAGDIRLSGMEDGKKMRNRFGAFNIRRAVFGDSMNVTKGILNAGNLSSSSISKYGDAGNLTADTLSVYDFSMAAGRTGFNGPAKWEVKGNAVLENVTLDAEQLEVSGFINASRGQDVFINEYDLTYASKSGIEANVVSAANLTLRDQTSSGLLNGGTGPVLIDLRLGGVSVLPDITIDGIDNNAIGIPSQIDDDSGAVTGCRNIIGALTGGVAYNQKSLSQNIVCRYVFWQRLERRIDLKKCMLEGKGGC